MSAAKTTFLCVVVLVLIMALEAIVFRSATASHYAWIYPRWADQLQYLSEAYRGYAQMQKAGFASAAWSALTAGAPQGSLHVIFALVAFTVAGPGRNSVLAVNLGSFLFLQLATFVGARRISGSAAWALAAAAIFASFQFPWIAGASSAVDFRLDWPADCAFGITLALAASGTAFRSQTGAAFFGVAVGLTILTRFLSVVYFGAILLALVIWVISLPDRRIRGVRLLVAAVVASLISGPILWRSHRAIYQYYWQSILDGPDAALRGARMGPISSVAWILSQLFHFQIGIPALGIALGSVFLLVALREKGEASESGSARVGTARSEPWVVAGIFLAAPACILVFVTFKDPQHVSILLAPVAWILALVWSHLAKRVSTPVSVAVAFGVTAASAAAFIHSEIVDTDSAKMQSDFRAVNAVGDYLYFRSEEAGLEKPTVAVTGHFEGLYSNTFEIMGLERHHRRIQFMPGLPMPLAAMNKNEALGDLRKSDFVCLVSGVDSTGGFNKEMSDMHSEMKALCEENLRRVGDIEVLGGSIELYERRTLGPAHDANLGTLIRDALKSDGNAEAFPPAAPMFIAPSRILTSTKVDFRFAMEAAYSPTTYDAESLPAGIHQVGDTSILEGRFSAPGDFVASVIARNPRGAKEGLLSVHVEDKATYAVLTAPKSCRVGEPVDVAYGAFDADGRLDFVEITDLTARKTLGRIEVPMGSKQSWLGTYRTAFEIAGRREILSRTVRFNPESAQHYSFEDQTCLIDVEP